MGILIQSCSGGSPLTLHHQTVLALIFDKQQARRLSSDVARILLVRIQDHGVNSLAQVTDK